MLMWSNGKFKENNEVSTLNWTMHYGHSVWEGMRSYRTFYEDAYIYRVREHIHRLFNSAKMWKLTIPFTEDELVEACNSLLRKIEDGRQELYFRPIVYPLGDAEGSKSSTKKVGVDIYAFKLKNSYDINGIKVITSNFIRSYPEYFMQCKSSNNYGDVTLYADEANRSNVDDVLLRDRNGYYTEASVANLFLVKDGDVFTSPNDGSILPGITRQTVMNLAYQKNITEVTEKVITKPDLITADEIFITGTYAEVTPIIEFDGYQIGRGVPGPITRHLKEEYMEEIRYDLAM